MEDYSILILFVLLHPLGWSVYCTVAFFNIYVVYVLIFGKIFLLKNLHNADYICIFALDIYFYSLICIAYENYNFCYSFRQVIE